MFSQSHCMSVAHYWIRLSASFIFLQVYDLHECMQYYYMNRHLMGSPSLSFIDTYIRTRTHYMIICQANLSLRCIEKCTLTLQWLRPYEENFKKNATKTFGARWYLFIIITLFIRPSVYSPKLQLPRWAPSAPLSTCSGKYIKSEI